VTKSSLPNNENLKNRKAKKAKPDNQSCSVSRSRVNIGHRKDRGESGQHTYLKGSNDYSVIKNFDVGGRRGTKN